MSLYDDASLVMIPSGKKDGKLYSIKPTDGSGDFTFSRDGAGASPATRVDADGNIETGRTNFLLQSNQFDTTWTTANASVTGGQADKDGGSDAWLLDISGGTDSQRIQQSVSTSGVQTLSVYAKAGTLNWMRLRVIGGSNPEGYFDLQNGLTGSTVAVIDSSIESVGNSFYRCSITFDATITEARIHLATADLNVTQGSGNIYIQDSQLENGLVATDYIETTTTAGYAGLLGDMPRLDYSGGATCPSLLLEPSRKNEHGASNYFDAFFSVASAGAGAVYNDTTSPQGVTNGTKIYPLTTGTFRGINKNFGSTLTNAEYTMSIFAKAAEFDQLYFYNVGAPAGNNGVWFNLTSGAVGTTQSAWSNASIEDWGNGWYRCSATITLSGTSDILYYLLADSNGSTTATANGTDGLHLYGAQLELGSYATSIIPTYGSTVTRAADDCEKESISALIGQTSGTMYAEYTPITDSGADVMRLDRTTNSSVVMYVPSNGTPRCRVYSGGAVVAEANAGADVVAGTLTKMAAVYDEAVGLKFWVDGTKYEDLTPFTFTQSLTEVEFGNVAFLQSTFNGSLGTAALWTTALSESEVDSLTTL